VALFSVLLNQISILGPVFSIALPAQGIEQLRDALSELLNEFGEGYLEDEPNSELPESRFLRIDNKIFYFDPEHNARGDFFKISEVKQAYGVRNSIAVSARALPQFTQILNELHEKLTQLRTDGTGIAIESKESVPAIEGGKEEVKEECKVEAKDNNTSS